jgi:hypothetical protein
MRMRFTRGWNFKRFLVSKRKGGERNQIGWLS